MGSALDITLGGELADRPRARAAASGRRVRRLVINHAAVPISRVEWVGARRMIQSPYPSIDPFEDIADPADWLLPIAAERKTNPRLMETIGNIDGRRP